MYVRKPWNSKWEILGLVSHAILHKIIAELQQTDNLPLCLMNVSIHPTRNSWPYVSGVLTRHSPSMRSLLVYITALISRQIFSIDTAGRATLTVHSLLWAVVKMLQLQMYLWALLCLTGTVYNCTCGGVTDHMLWAHFCTSLCRCYTCELWVINKCMKEMNNVVFKRGSNRPNERAWGTLLLYQEHMSHPKGSIQLLLSMW